MVDFLYWIYSFIESFFSPKPRLYTIMHKKLAKALTYEGFKQTAQELDDFEGKTAWKLDIKSNLYDFKTLTTRLRHTEELLQSNSATEILFFLRSGGIRNLGGYCNPKLHKYCSFGTKVLIEDYVNATVGLIKIVGDFKSPPSRNNHGEDVDMTEMPPGTLDRNIKMAFCGEMLQSIGRTALILHGGASFGTCHIGVAKALFERGMLPKIICGSYIGALMAAFLCTRSEGNMEQAFMPDLVDLSMFKSDGSSVESIGRKIGRLLKYGNIFDIEILQKACRANFGNITFKEAFKLSGFILNITVNTKRKSEVPVLLNYLTAPDVLVWSAACASCALPGFYEEVILMVKNENEEIVPWNPTQIRFESAKMVQEMPLTRLTELFNANNFIVSHVPSFWSSKIISSDGRKATVVGRLVRFVGSEIRHRIDQLEAIGLLPELVQRFVSFLAPPDYGDVIITPAIYFSDFSYYAGSLNKEYIKHYMLKGERAVWTKLSEIKTRCSIEFAIDNVLDDTKTRRRPTGSVYISKPRKSVRFSTYLKTHQVSREDVHP